MRKRAVWRHLKCFTSGSALFVSMTDLWAKTVCLIAPSPCGALIFR